MSYLYFNTSKSAFLDDPTLENLVWYRKIDQVSPRVIFHREPYYPDHIIPCSYSSGNKPQVNIDKVQFGDGYEQVSDSGINPVRHVFNVVFSNKRDAVSKALMRFFGGEPDQTTPYDRRPSEYFYWLPPSALNTRNRTELIKVRCESWDLSASDYNASVVNAVFTESFEPGLPS